MQLKKLVPIWTESKFFRHIPFRPHKWDARGVGEHIDQVDPLEVCLRTVIKNEEGIPQGLEWNTAKSHLIRNHSHTHSKYDCLIATAPVSRKKVLFPLLHLSDNYECSLHFHLFRESLGLSLGVERKSMLLSWLSSWKPFRIAQDLTLKSDSRMAVSGYFVLLVN